MAGTKEYIHHFEKGEEVEISLEDEGFRGSLYLGTVIRPADVDNMVLIEYKTLVANDAKRTPLKEEVDVVQLRPLPPQEVRRSFKMSEEVDVYDNDGWWEGVITKVHDSDRYSVYFRVTRQQSDFSGSQLRLHREWVYGNWVPPLENVVEEMMPDIELPKYKFTPGMLVEVSSDEDGFKGAFFQATVIKRLGEDKYLIEYKSLRNEDDTEFLREEAYSQHVRPYPPEITVIDGYSVKDEVDVLCNDGWWAGVITKVLKRQRYRVYFSSTDEDFVYEYSDLRPHHEWVNGKWVLPSRV